MSEYSYYFVLKWFLPALEKIGEVKIILDPLTEADKEYDLTVQSGRSCVLFSFAPPHQTLMPKRCPIVPLVAWEFERIPDHQWDDNPFTDWRIALKQAGMAITHSEFAKQAILRAMTPDFPVWSIPAPVWDRFAARGLALHGPEGRNPGKGIDIHVRGTILDSATRIPSSPQPHRVEPKPRMSRQERRKSSVKKFMAKIAGIPWDPNGHAAMVARIQNQKVESEQVHHIQAKGIIYTSILNSRDGRKNWGDIATAFVSAFQDVEDAVLIFKLNERDSALAYFNLERDLRRFTWMKCRVIAFNGYLPDDDYQRFLDGIDYVVNASTGEGQCLPLMELMSMGTPAIAPDHTSMADYITPENAFILPSNKFLTGWPHDPRFIYSTTAFQVPWEELRKAYDRSYRTAKFNPEDYRAMSRAATVQLEQHCSLHVAISRINEVLMRTQSQLPTND
jgi:glycosyltransferase involved in cell wall biosynthesis